MRSSSLLGLAASFLVVPSSWAFVPAEVKQQWKDGYTLDEALDTITDCAERREDQDKLYNAVRFIDRNAHRLYKTMEDKEQLFEKALGSWELRMAYEDARNDYFIPFPDFRDYAMAFTVVEKDYFGKGIASGPEFAFVSMGGPAKFNIKTRQLFMDYQDFYISGNQVPEWDLSYFMRGYARNWYDERRKRPPLAFTLIGATDDVMIVRGSKTGGMAVFTRIDEDMREAAYGGAR